MIKHIYNSKKFDANRSTPASEACDNYAKSTGYADQIHEFIRLVDENTGVGLAASNVVVQSTKPNITGAQWEKIDAGYSHSEETGEDYVKLNGMHIFMARKRYDGEYVKLAFYARVGDDYLVVPHDIDKYKHSEIIEAPEWVDLGWHINEVKSRMD